MTIKAFLLSAGLGTRLRPITDQTPKCLVPLGGVPLLEIWLKKLEQIGCSSVLINTHYLSDQVDEFLSNYTPYTSMTITTIYEPSLLGTAGSLISNLDFFDSQINIVIHADNFMYQSLSLAIEQHRQNRPWMTMVTFATETPESCGIVTLDHHNMITSFHEKTADVHGNIANSAIYIFDEHLVSYLRDTYSSDNRISDISTELIPTLVGQMQSWHTNQFFTDIGNLASYIAANRYYQEYGIEECPF